MKRQIPWLRITAEGFAIVASILIALAVDAWWAEVEARRQARQELASVLEEVVEAQAEIERVALWQDRSLSATTALRSLIDATPLGRSVTVPDTLLATLGLFHIGDVPTQSVEAFISSGQVGRLESEELRRHLIAWPSFVTDLHDDEVRIRDSVDALISLLSQRVDMSSAHDMSMAMFRAGPGAQAPSDAQSVSVPVELAVRNGFALQITMSGTAVLQSNEMKTRSARLHSLILGELAH